jgi:hypothetical protein
VYPRKSNCPSGTLQIRVFILVHRQLQLAHAALRRNHSPAHPARNLQQRTELKTAIDEWIEHRNQNSKPFKWTASAKSILAKHRRAKKALAIAKSGMQMNESEH